MNRNYSLSPVDSVAGAFVSWCFDFPAVDQPFACDLGGAVSLRGWALSASGGSVEVLTRLNGVVRCFPMMVKRPDVIRAVLGEDPDGHSRVMCGFNIEMPVVDGAEVGVVVNGEVFWIGRFDQV